MLSEDNLNLKEFQILDEKYILLKKIGSGATCKVKLAKKIGEDTLLAIKILTTMNGRSINKHHTAEIEMLKKINHQNIINLKEGNKGVIKKPDGRTKIVDYIVLEYACNGELFDYIYFPREGLAEKMARAVFKGLIEGLEGCHMAGVTHRDLKTENLMMNEQWILKIADFGYATLLSGKTGDGMLRTFLGTLSYAAPEILNKKPYIGSMADIFSCGVILFVLVTGKLPFGKAVMFDSYYKNFIKNDYEAFWSIMSPKIVSVTPEFKSLVNLMLAYEPSQRPTLGEIKAHPWYNMEYPGYEEYVKEFERRKVIVTQMKEIEVAEEAKKKKTGNYGGVYRGECENEVKIFAGDRIVHSMSISGTPYKLKLKGLKGETIIDNLNFIVEFFTKVDVRSKTVNPHEENAKFRVEYEIEKDTAEILSHLELEKLVIDVEIRKNSNEEFFVIFNKTSGDKLDFFNIFDEFINHAQNYQK